MKCFRVRVRGWGKPHPYSFLLQRLLAGFDEELGVFDWGVLEDAVAEIQDVACAAEGCHGFLRGAANFFGRAEEDGWVDVALHGDARAEILAECAHIDAPVDAQDVCAGTGYSWQQVMRGFRVINDGSRGAQSRGRR